MKCRFLNRLLPSNRDDKESKSLPHLPMLVLQDVFEYLCQNDLKTCRQVCQSWNSWIISGRYIPGVVDYYFNLCLSKPPKQSFKFFQKKKKNASNDNDDKSVSYADFLQLQESYSRNLTFLEDPRYYEPKIKIVGLELLPDIWDCISPPFYQILARISSLELKPSDLPEEISAKKISPSEFSRFLGWMTGLKKLKFPAVYLALIDEQDMEEMRSTFANITDLQLTFSDEVFILNEDGIGYNGDVFYKAGELMMMMEGLKRLSVKWPLKPCVRESKMDSSLRKDMERREGILESFLEILDSTLTQKILPCCVFRLSHIDLREMTIPAKIFDHYYFRMLVLALAVNGLSHISFNLEAELLSTSLASSIEMLSIGMREERSIIVDSDLSLKLIYDNMSSHVQNNFILSLPDIYPTISKLTFYFTRNYAKTIPGVYCLRQFLPKYERCEANNNFVVYRNLTSLRIETEKTTSKIFFDFVNIADCCPNLVELVCIEGPKERYETEWRMIKSLWFFAYAVADGMICGWHFRWIMECFRKLERLTIWSWMFDLTDEVFVFKDRQTEEGLRPEVQRTIGEFLPKLKTVSLRGVGNFVTNKALVGFNACKHLEELEILGIHTITKQGKTELMKNVPTLHTFRFKC